VTFTSIQLIAPCRIASHKMGNTVTVIPGVVDRIWRDGDVVRFEGASVVPGTIVPWGNVAGAVEADEPKAATKRKAAE
jgi:hypothetical protein